MSISSVDELKEWFSYDPLTGHFTRIKYSRLHNGQIPKGYTYKDGYILLSYDKYRVAAHRAAWAYINGKWPDGDIDHEDGHYDHNWIDNLRETNHIGNGQNRRRLNSNNISGHIGVYWHNHIGYWIAKIDGKHIGSYKTIEEAVEARRVAKLQYHEFQPVQEYV